MRDEGAGASAEQRFRQAALGCLDGLYRFALALSHDRAVAEDLVQETYVRALGARHKVDADENVRSWMFVILHNVWRNERRRRRPAADEDDLARLSTEEDPGQALDRRATGLRLHEAIDRLPAPFREVLLLRCVEELSYKDIARVLDCPAGTVMSRLARARALLKGALAGPVAVPSPREVAR